MKVLVVTVAHPPLDARIHNRQIRAILHAGHEVTYVAPWSTFGAQVPADVHAVDVPRSVGRHRVGPLAAAARIVRRLAPQHDVVIGHDPELLPLLHAIATGRNAPAVVWDVHEDVPAQFEMVDWVPGPVKVPAARVATAIEHLTEKRLHLTLAEYAYADRFRRRHPVVPNSPRVPADLPPEEPRLPGEPWRVIYVGAITRARGFDEMVALVDRLPQGPDGMVLELIGNARPDLDAELRAITDPRLDYRGFVPNAEALSRLHGSLAGLVLLHDHDNYKHSQASKALEYMAHGVPVVSTPNPASVDLVRGTGCGVVVDFGDVDGILDTLLQLRDDPDRRQAMRVAGHTAALARHDWNRQGAEFVDALESWARGARAVPSR
ncbi:glycosyltransferase [Kineococcus gynurae]|uniref:Glycosyltransferase n=1 Tax=Kineococcus gynurae TaxID=452979 RepID=A0ABV5LRH6_9ACTN